MGVLFVQRVADSTGALAPATRALKFGSGFTLTAHPSDVLAGAQGGDGEITGYEQIDLVANAASATWRPAVRAAIASNVSTSSCSTTQDGLTLVAGDVVLLFAQTAPAQNGAYVVGTVVGSAAPLTRVTWMSAAGDFSPGMRIPVTEGTTYATAIFMQATTSVVVVGTTALAFALMTAQLPTGGAATLSIWRPLVRAVSISNVASLAAASVTQDGVTLVAGDLVLLASQTTAAQNGVYVVGTVTTGTAPLTRVSWMSSSSDLVTGLRIPVGPEGAQVGSVTMELDTAGPMTLGTTPLSFSICAIPAVTSTAPITVTGLAVPNIGISAATGSTPGSMSAADKTKLDAASASPTASVLALRDGSGNLKAAAIDSGASADLALWRNGTLVAALKAASIAFAFGIASPALAQDANGTDVACNDFSWTPQAPWASATSTHRNPGNAVVALSDPTNGQNASGYVPSLEVKQGSNYYVATGRRLNGAVSNYGVIWFGNVADPATRSDTNYCFGSDGSTSSVFNTPGGGNLFFTYGGTAVGTCTASLWSFPTTNFAIDALSLAGSVTFVDGFSPTIGQALNTTTNGSGLLIAAQSTTFAGSTGGSLTLQSGNGASSPGSVVVKISSTVQLTLSSKLTQLNQGQFEQVRNVLTWASTTAIDWSTGNVQQVTLAGASTTFTQSNMKDGAIYYLMLIQDATGGRTVTWPGTVKLAGGAFTPSSGASKRDLLTFVSDGTNLYESARALNI